MTGRPVWAATALFSPPGSARYDPDMSEQPGPDKYVETPRDRRIANAVLLLFLVLIVGGGILACQCDVRPARARQLHGAGPHQLCSADRRAAALTDTPTASRGR